MVAKYFPHTHPCKGESTYFRFKIDDGAKKHTIRENYPLWKQRIDEVNAGAAIISVRQWIGKPSRSKQVEIGQLKAGEIGYERIGISHRDEVFHCWIGEEGSATLLDEESFNDLAKNDGLELDDFITWFFPLYMNVLCDDMIIIHFTNLRYAY